MLNQSFLEIKDYMVNLVKRSYKSRVLKNVFKILLIPSLKQRPQSNIN